MRRRAAQHLGFCRYTLTYSSRFARYTRRVRLRDASARAAGRGGVGLRWQPCECCLCSRLRPPAQRSTSRASRRKTFRVTTWYTSRRVRAARGAPAPGRPQDRVPVAEPKLSAAPGLVSQVNSLVSAKSALPIEYYSLPFCRPAKIVSSAENLGEARPARAGGDATREPDAPCPPVPAGAARRPHLQLAVPGADPTRRELRRWVCCATRPRVLHLGLGTCGHVCFGARTSEPLCAAYGLFAAGVCLLAAWPHAPLRCGVRRDDTTRRCN